MKTIGILSDTHGHLPEVAVDQLRDCDRIIHAGDICGSLILPELETVAPVVAVLGNNDYPDYGSAVNASASFVEEGVRFVITHEPRHILSALQTQLGEVSSEEPVVVVYGHTHVPHIECGGYGLPYELKLNPGAIHRVPCTSTAPKSSNRSATIASIILGTYALGFNAVYSYIQSPLFAGKSISQHGFSSHLNNVFRAIPTWIFEPSQQRFSSHSNMDFRAISTTFFE